jgi:hypothetical protein
MHFTDTGAVAMYDSGGQVTITPNASGTLIVKASSGVYFWKTKFIPYLEPCFPSEGEHVDDQ